MIFLLALLMLCSYSGYSAQQDATKVLRVLSSVQLPDAAKVDKLNSFAEEYMQDRALDSVEMVSNHAIRISEKIHYKIGLAVALANRAKVYYIQGDYSPALKLILKSLQHAEASAYKSGVAVCLNVIGLIHLAQGQKKASLQEFRRASKINTEIGDQYRLSTNYFNMGLAYRELKLTDSALNAFKKTQEISERIKHLNMQAMASNRLADTYFSKNQIELAIQQYRTVLDNKAYQNEWENSFAYTGLAQCYEKQQLFQQAILFAQKGLELAKKKKTKWDAGRAFGVLNRSYAELKNYKEAYTYLYLEKVYADSLMSESKENELNALQLQHQRAANQVLIQENQLVHQKNKFSRQIVLLSAFIILLLVSFLIFLFKNTRTKSRLNRELLSKSANLAAQKEKIQQQNIALNELNQTKDQLFSIISHDLRSPFAAIIATLRLLKDMDISKDELNYLLHHLYEQTAATSAMMDNLLVWAKSQQGGITTHPSHVLIPEVTAEVLSVFQSIANEKHIEIKYDESPHAYAHADRDQLKIIVQNILANAIKFSSANGTIHISYSLTDHSVCLKIRDNGVGMSFEKVQQLFRKSGSDISTRGTNNETGIGIGLILVKKFVDSNKATISIDSAESRGTEFLICFQRAPSKEE